MSSFSLKDALSNYDVLLLNFEYPSFTLDLLKHAHSFICADNALSRYHKLTHGIPMEEKLIPYAVIGDFDSIDQTLIKSYESLGMKVVHDEDQWTTDLEKCFEYICREYGSKPDEGVFSSPYLIVLGALGGRFDHEMYNMHVLLKRQQGFRSVSSSTPAPQSTSGTTVLYPMPQRIVYFNESCIVTCLPGCPPIEKTEDQEESSTPSQAALSIESAPLHTIIPFPECETNSCGFIPIGHPCLHCKTTGFVWDVDGSMEFTGLLSTSNSMLSLPFPKHNTFTDADKSCGSAPHQAFSPPTTVSATPVTIRSTHSLLWTSAIDASFLTSYLSTL